MKREIKFRGKRLDNSEWVYGHYSDFNFNPDGLVKMRYYITVSIGGREYEVVAETVGQFTGLFDNNGKEIYEGDILRRVCYSAETNRKEVIYHSEVYWRERAACWGIKNPTKTGGWSKMLDANRVFNNVAQVVGNIHDNPELLKTE